MKRLYFLMSLCLLAGCLEFDFPEHSEAAINTNIDIPHLVNLLELNSTYTDHLNPIIVNGMLIFTSTEWETGKWWLAAYDKTTLEKLWHWQEGYDNYGRGCFSKAGTYIHNNILVTKLSNISYGIDINSGATLWHSKGKTAEFSMMAGIGELVCSSRMVDDTSFVVQLANIESGEWEDIYSFRTEAGFRAAGRIPTLFQRRGVNYAAFITTKSRPGSRISYDWLNLYNLSEKRLEWISDTIPESISRNYWPGSPLFENGQICLANGALYAYSFENGSLDWQKEFDNSLMFLTADKGKVYVSNEDDNLIGVDVKTGNQNTITKVGKYFRKVHAQNNKLYLCTSTRGGRGHLLEINAENGNILNEAITPFYDQNDDCSFEYDLVVDPETGAAYVFDHRHLLVYNFNQ